KRPSPLTGFRFSHRRRNASVANTNPVCEIVANTDTLAAVNAMGPAIMVNNPRSRRTKVPSCPGVSVLSDPSPSWENASAVRVATFANRCPRSRPSIMVTPTSAMAAARSRLRGTSPRSRASFRRLPEGFSVLSPAPAMRLPERPRHLHPELGRRRGEPGDERRDVRDDRGDDEQTDDETDGRADDHQIDGRRRARHETEREFDDEQHDDQRRRETKAEYEDEPEHLSDGANERLIDVS